MYAWIEPMPNERYELSVVIPTLDETAHLPSILDDLSRQQDSPQFEVIVVDGGSQDGTLEWISSRSWQGNLALHVEHSEPGRGRQLNAGAKAARADVLLVLHADSRLPSRSWLGRACREFCSMSPDSASAAVAGHHPLRFFPDQRQASLAYYYFAAKSSLNLFETINGDQGLWISKSFLHALGGFDESLPYMEDARIARKIFAAGRWVVLDGHILSSHRRFDSQGMAARQCVNALMRLFDAVDCPAYFAFAKDAYGRQSVAERLQITPFLAAGHRALWSGGLRSGLSAAWRLGRVSSEQIWQIAFLLDVCSAWRRRIAPEQVPQRWLGGYQRRLAWFFESAPIAFFAAIVHGVLFAAANLLRRFPSQSGFSTRGDSGTSMDGHTTGRNTTEETAHK